MELDQTKDQSGSGSNERSKWNQIKRNAFKFLKNLKIWPIIFRLTSTINCSKIIISKIN